VAASESVVLVVGDVARAIKTTTDERTKVAGQANVGITGAIQAGAFVHAKTKFSLENSLQAIAQVFGTLETDAATSADTGGEFTTVINLERCAAVITTVHITVIHTAVDGDIGLREDSGRSQAS